MPRISWDAVGERFFEQGIDRGVLYPNDNVTVAWNGLVSVTETGSSSEATEYFFDGYQYYNDMPGETFKATLQAYTYPDEFAEADGIKNFGMGLLVPHQPRKSFGLCYRTRIGNDVDGPDFAYKLHFIYNATATSTDKVYNTRSQDVDPSLFSWNLTAKPVRVSSAEPSAHFIVDSRYTTPSGLSALENVIYGTAGSTGRLPFPDEIQSLLGVEESLSIVNNGDGTFTATGDGVANGGETFDLSGTSVISLDANRFSASTS